MSTPATTHKPVATQAPKLPRPRLPRRNRGLLSDDEIVPWSIWDKLGLAAAWFCGLLLCAIAGSIVIYMLVRGIQYVKLDALFQHPVVLSTTQSTGTIGGYLDPIEGTLILTALGTLLALPIGVGIGVVFLGETPGTTAYFGLVLVIAGVVAMTMPARRPAAVGEA